ncbi:ABC transporter permease [Billgrantia ethanolica]|uniref:ABC transporter permease n=1 Tax=Billgrantia ethanolica TaxID=2733486 RepID=A0ABS9A242_9GAMM|nr:ABC transporter permease [Halomonas ethanolica]MCE8002893.1 ABC transporter permease [Halomonas ethanolica]
MWIEGFIAWSLLRDGRAQTALMLVGIMVGAAVVVFISTLIGGLQANIIERTLGTQAHIRLLPPEEFNRVLPLQDPASIALVLEDRRPQRLRSIDNWQALVPVLDRWPGVTAVSPTISGPALAVRGSANRSVSIIGADAERLRGILPIADHMVEGVFRLRPGEILIGRELADDLGLQSGDRMRLDTAGERTVIMTVAGVFELGVREIDNRLMYLDLDEARSLLDLPGGVSALELTVAEVFAADRLALRLGALTGQRAESWMETNAQLLNALRSQTLSTTMIRSFVSLSVAFGIASVLAVSVVQRTREIGILRAMGLGRGRILRVFLIQGALLGLAGGGLGALFGSLLVLAFDVFGPRLFVIGFDPWLIPAAMALASMAGLAAAAWPASRAARLDPAVAIRHV